MYPDVFWLFGAPAAATLSQHELQAAGAFTYCQSWRAEGQQILPVVL